MQWPLADTSCLASPSLLIFPPVAPCRPACVRDSCAHRACPLSIGKIQDGEVSCPYHGWTFKGDGECTKMPSTVFIKGVRVDALHCEEADGCIWVYPGSEEPPGVLPTQITEPPKGFQVHAEIVLEVRSAAAPSPLPGLGIDFAA